jgi:signal transduction histidine kinase
LGCRRRNAHIRIEVLDTGVGIPPDKLSKIFEAFHRLDWTRADGLGLGLFVVRRASDLLEHQIFVRSLLGHGSCFSILAKAPLADGDSATGLHGAAATLASQA